MWECFERIIKPNGAMVFTSSEPFKSKLVTSNIKIFRYCWVWQKTRPTLSLHANKRPLKNHEDIVVFYKKQPTYNPQMTRAKTRKEGLRTVNAHPTYSPKPMQRKFDNKGLAYPRTVIQIPNPNHDNIHPTQKPVDLFEYLIKTYTNEGDTVLDPCAGSFTTAVACHNTNRSWICIELDNNHFNDSIRRLKSVRYEDDLFEQQD